MRTNILIILICFIIFSCHENRNQNKEAVTNNHALNGSINDSQIFGTNDQMINNYLSFTNFIYTFSIDSTFQVSSIKFPLTKKSIDNINYVQKEDWKYHSLYSNQIIKEEGIIIYNDTSHMGLSEDTSLYEQTVSFFAFDTFTTYHFSQNEKSWQLVSIHEVPINKVNDDFIKFLYRFAEDSIFQKTSIDFPLKSIYLTYENDEYLPKQFLKTRQEYKYNTYFKNRFANNIPIEIRDISTSNSSFRQIRIFNQVGLYVRYLFEKQNDNWTLIKYEDTSM